MGGGRGERASCCCGAVSLGRSDLTGVVDLRYTGGARMLLMLEVGGGRWKFKVRPRSCFGVGRRMERRERPHAWLAGRSGAVRRARSDVV